jgi:4-amino-4-deoxy-L-arabinose transferase-like glycosyltransferase
MNSLMPVVTLFIAAILVISFSLFVTSLLKVQSITVFILSLYLLSFANIVLVCEIAGSANLLNSKYFFIFVHLVLTVVVLFIWWRTGRPSLFEPITKSFKTLKWKDLWISQKEWPELWLFVIAVGGIYLFGAFLILKVPPNNWDSMTCHMTRIGYWLQHGNFWPWPTWDFTQQVYPINAQVQMLWSILFWGWDQFAGFAQWLAAIIGMIVIFGLARLIGFSIQQSVFAGLVWALLPEVLLESTTVQNHLITGTLFTCMIYLFFLGIRPGNNNLLVLSGLAFGLTLGSHQIAFFTLPGVFLLSISVLIKYGKKVYESILLWGVASLIAFLLVGSYMYIINISLYGNPFHKTDISPAESISNNISNHGSINENIKYININISRYIYSIYDFTGLPPSMANPIYKLKYMVGSTIFSMFNIPIEDDYFSLKGGAGIISEDTAWFGIVGSLLIFPLLFIQGYKGLKNRDLYRLGIVLIVVAYVFTWSFYMGIYSSNNIWSYFQGRYFIIMASIIAPLFASTLRKGILRPIGTLLIILSIYSAGYSTINSYSKPLTGEWAIWDKGRLQKQDIPSKGRYYGIIHFVELNVPDNNKLGLVLFYDFFEYPFFGKTFNRNLIPIYPDSKLSDSDWISKNEINWIVLCKPLPYPSNFIEIGRYEAYHSECSLLKRKL